jgi:hypothetical protein
MALFQSTVIEKYSNAQDQKVLKEKWEAYKVQTMYRKALKTPRVSLGASYTL